MPFSRGEQRSRGEPQQRHDRTAHNHAREQSDDQAETMIERKRENGAAPVLDVAPHELLMVAAHPSDLAAAARAGLRTAYVPRPLEYGPGGGLHDAPGAQTFDVVAADFGALADRLGA